MLELLVGTAGAHLTAYNALFRRQFCGVMAQSVAAWCRRRGHVVSYLTYYGQRSPDRMVPDDTDLVFISAFTEAAALAYALSSVLRKRGVRTVLGGPHAKSFPTDALRFFDIVVKDCHAGTIADIADGHIDSGLVDDPNRLLALPPLAERRDDLDRATLLPGRYARLSVVPLLSSVGCPYTCDFCIDSNNRYQLRPVDELTADLDYVASAMPGRTIVFHDPNFGVSFEKTLAAIEHAGARTRLSYMAESSLSILKEQRLARLRESGCVYVAPAIESWFDYDQKSGGKSGDAQSKFERIADHFELIGRHIPGVQANFLFGVDSDSGPAPAELTRAFIRRFPNVFPGLAYPIAFGGVPLRDRLRATGRLLALPPCYYFDPIPTLILQNYHVIELFELMASMFWEAGKPSMLLKRASTALPAAIRLTHVLRGLELALYARRLRAFLDLVRNTPTVRAFCEGRTTTIPGAYDNLLDRRLGPYRDALTRNQRHVIAAE